MSQTGSQAVRKCRRKRPSFFVFLAVVIVFSALVYGLGETWGFSVVKEKLRDFAETRLNINNYVCDADNLEKADKKRSAVYVLGGSQGSLRLKYPLAATLYDTGAAETIMVLHQDGITQYDPDLGRNLTKREWTVRELANLGVVDENIEFVSIESGFFGTFSEAGTLANISEGKEIQELFLVCSSYHCRRVETSFRPFFKNNATEIKICGVDKNIGVRGLLFEYGKLLVYEYILIPYKEYADSSK
jgi:hypothetical protein